MAHLKSQIRELNFSISDMQKIASRLENVEGTEDILKHLSSAISEAESVKESMENEYDEKGS